MKLQLLTFPTSHTTSADMRRSGYHNQTNPFSKCWLTVSIFVPSLGLISFQGVGFSFVQTTEGSTMSDYVRALIRGMLTCGPTSKSCKIPGSPYDNEADNGKTITMLSL